MKQLFPKISRIRSKESQGFAELANRIKAISLPEVHNRLKFIYGYRLENSIPETSDSFRTSILCLMERLYDLDKYYDYRTLYNWLEVEGYLQNPDYLRSPNAN